MSKYLILLTAAIVCSVVSAVKEPLGEELITFSSESCQSNLDVGTVYEFNYEGTLEHTDASTSRKTTGIKIECLHSLITELDPCTASLQLENCKLYSKDGDQRSYSVGSKSSQKMAKKLTRYPLYFHHNQGEVIKTFVHRKDQDDILNIKKGILSAVSLNIDDVSTDGTDTISTKSIFGERDTGVVVEGNNVRTVRNLDKIVGDSILRVPGLSASKYPFMTKVQSMMDQYMAPTGEQVCEYNLYRGSRVRSVTCTETRNGFEIIKDNPEFMSTSVQQVITFTSKDSASRNLSPAALQNIKRNYLADDIVYSNQLKQIKNPLLSGQTGYQIAVTNLDALSAGNVSSQALEQLEQWVAQQSGETLTRFWDDYSSNHHFGQHETYWIKALAGCLDPKWCQDEKECIAHSGCQSHLASVLSAYEFIHKNDKVESQYIAMLADVEHPSPRLLQAALHLSRRVSKPSYILGLGKVLNKFKTSTYIEGNHPAADEAQAFLESIVQDGCSSPSHDVDSQSVLLNAIKSLAPLNEVNLEQFDSCISLDNSDVVKIAYIQSLQAKNTIADGEIRSALMDVFQEKTNLVQMRLSALLALLTTNPTATEIHQIDQKAGDDTESNVFTKYVSEFIHAQVQLQGTEFAVLNSNTIDLIKNDVGVHVDKIRQENYQTTEALFIPGLKKNVDIVISLDTYTLGSNPLPEMGQLTINAKMEGGDDMEVLRLRVDVARLLAVGKELLKSEKYVLTNPLSHLFSLPLDRWIPTLFKNKSYFSETLMKNYKLLREQYDSVKALRPLFQIPFLDLKIFGSDVGTSSNDQSGEMTIAQLFDMLFHIDKGGNWNKAFSAVPVLYEQAVPTSIGTPLKTYFKMASLIDISISGLFQMTELYFTGRGDTYFNWNAKFDASMAYEQAAVLTSDILCGSATTVEIAHNSEFHVQLKNKAKSFSASIRFPEREELATIRIMSGNEQPSADSQNLFNQERSVTWHLDALEYSFIVDWDKDIDDLSSGFNMKMERDNVVLLDMTAGYHPENQQIMMIVDSNDVTVFTMNSTVAVNPDEDDSFKLNFGSTVQGKSFIQLEVDIVKEAVEEESLGFGSVFKSFWGWGSTEEEEEEEEEVEEEYKVTGYLSFGEAELSVSGAIGIPDENNEYSAEFEVFAGSVITVKLFNIDWKNVAVDINGHQGYNVSVEFKDFSTDIMPVSSMGMFEVRVNDTEHTYNKHLKFSFVPLEGESHYLDLRMEIERPDEDDVSLYDWMATATTSGFQGQWSVDSTTSDSMDIVARFLYPHNDGYPMHDLETTSQRTARYSLDHDKVSYFNGFDVSFRTNPESSVEAQYILHNEKYVAISQKFFDNCKSCFETSLESADISGLLGYTPKGLSFSLVLPDITNVNGMLQVNSLTHGASITAKFEESKLGGGDITGSYQLYGLTDGSYEAVLSVDSLLDFSANDVSTGASLTFAFADNSKGLSYKQYLNVGEVGVNTTTSSVYTTSERVMDTLNNKREIVFDSASQSFVSSEIVSLEYNPSSEHDVNTAPYTVTKRSEMTNQPSQVSTIDLYLRNAPVMEELLENVCDSNVNCRKETKNLEKKRASTSSASLSNLLDDCNSKYSSLLSTTMSQAFSSEDSGYSAAIQSTEIGNNIFAGGPAVLTQIEAWFLSGRYIETAEDAMIQAKEYVKHMAWSNSSPTNSIDIKLIQVTIQNIFQIIYDVEYAFGNLIENPSSFVSTYAGAAMSDIYSQTADIFKNDVAIGSYKAKTTLTESGVQLHTFNDFELSIPHTSTENSECTWLIAMDLSEGIIDAYFRGSSLYVAFMNAVAEFQAGGRVRLMNADNDFVEVEFPFEFGMMMCSKGSDSSINCDGMFSRMSINSENGETSWYGEISNQWMVPEFGGLMGVPGASENIEQMILQDMQLREHFLNFMELSHDPSCVVSAQAFNEQNRGSFRKTEIVPPSPSVNCVNEQVAADHGHVIFMLSLSQENTADRYGSPSGNMETIVSALESNEVDGTQYSLVTFGGEKQWYHPFLVTMNSNVMGNVRDLQAAYNTVGFYGPSYHESNTKAAISSIAKTLNGFEASLKKIVVMVPEINEMDAILDSEMIRNFEDQLTDIYFITNSYPSNDDNVENVYYSYQESQLASKISRDIKRSLRRGVTCSCEDMKTTCSF